MTEDDALATSRNMPMQTILPTIPASTAASQKAGDDVPARTSDRLVYSAYRPRTLEEAREYTRFVMTHRSIPPNEPTEADAGSDLNLEELPFGLSPQLRSYLQELAQWRKGRRSHGQ